MCPNSHSKLGHHEDYVDVDAHCRFCPNCRAESYVQGYEPVHAHPVGRHLPTFEDMYEVVGGSIVVERD